MTLKFLTFKANQYFRLNGMKITEEEGVAWVMAELRSKSDLMKQWVGEFNQSKS